MTSKDQELSIERLEHQMCPFCHSKNLTLTQQLLEVPYFGKMYVFGMDCSNCNYHKGDLEAAEPKEPARYSLEITSEEDLKIRVIKSSEAIVKIPHVTTISPGPNAEGYITNIEGILNRVKKEIEEVKEAAEDDKDKKKAKNLLKKLQKVMWGQEKLKITIDDPSGNSAIISDKAEKISLKQK